MLFRRYLPFLLLALLPLRGAAQVHITPIFSDLHLEARAEFDHTSFDNNDESQYGFAGRYFNFRIGGYLNESFSYYFRQRIIARPGASTLFDNTDYLYLNYKASSNWSFRAGKDALYVGGFEYDAPPIDVYFNSYYWDEFNCFQLAASAAFTSDDGKQMVAFQVANSPYIYSLADKPADFDSEYQRGLLSYNLFWSGTFGHFQTLYSINMFERKRGYFMNFIALGHKLKYDRWDIYVDLMHHSLGIRDRGDNFGIVSCANWLATPWLNLFVKGGYEFNHSKLEIDYAAYLAGAEKLDILARPETDNYFYGVGFELSPTICKDVRLYGCISRNIEVAPDPANLNRDLTRHTLNAKLGLTWFMDIHRMIKERSILPSHD